MKEQQEEKLVRCPKWKECKEDCIHKEKHSENNECIDERYLKCHTNDCPPCIPVSTEQGVCKECKGSGEKPISEGWLKCPRCKGTGKEPEQICKHENAGCKYPGCLENDCTGFEPKQPEQEKLESKPRYEACIHSTQRKDDYPICRKHGIKVLHTCLTCKDYEPDCKGTGLKSKVEGVEEINNKIKDWIMFCKEDLNTHPDWYDGNLTDSLLFHSEALKIAIDFFYKEKYLRGVEELKKEYVQMAERIKAIDKVLSILREEKEKTND